LSPEAIDQLSAAFLLAEKWDGSVYPMSKVPIWYVSYRSNRIPRKSSHQRLTETFLSESDAKMFALARLADSKNITAGTINPHVPKRVIGSNEIVAWVEKTH
jgi:hypothetical protein